MKLGKTNRNYKDRLFRFIFGNPENRRWTLSLYNAVNGSNYNNPDDITYNTIEDAVYMNMKNDVSFIIKNTLSLYEQQSTYCPNMPLRFLMYLAMLYDAYLEKMDLYIYGTDLQNIPRPKCICFYNGLDKQEDRRILKLSEMFFKDTRKSDEEISGIVELEVIMLNINHGHNKELLKKSRPLYEYAFFVERIRFYVNKFEKEGKEYTLEDVVDTVISELPKDFQILEFLLAHKAEVKGMCLFEYNEERHMRGEREEGRKEGKITLLVKLVSTGKLSISEASEEANMTVKEFEKILTNNG